jgi:hypothetical protein
MMDIVDRCQDLYGALSENNKLLLRNVLRCACEKNWIQARRIVVSTMPILTLEMAVKQVARGRGEDTPDAFTIYRALHHAFENRDRWYDAVNTYFQNQPN